MNFATLIEKGVNIKLTFEYNPILKINYRPLSDWELDEIDLMIYDKAENRGTKEYLYKLRSTPTLLPEKIPENIDINHLVTLAKERVYWIALKSISDYYDDLSYSEEGLKKIKKMIGIKKLVREILTVSGRTKEAEAALKSFREQSNLSTEKAKTSN
jgi:hypothetical protein